MAELRVSMFGPFEVEWGSAGPALDSQKAQELFAYLLLHPGRMHQREVLAGVLWCDQESARSRQYLRKALWQLQSRLHACDGNGVLLVTSDGVGVSPEAGARLDVESFRRGCARGHGIAGKQLERGQAASLREALALYKGELLEGWYSEWCLLEREQLHTMYVGAADKLIAYCEAHGEYEEGIELAHGVLRYDRAREHTHRALMRLLFLSGDRTGALRQFERCKVALRADLDIGPAPVTVALAEQVRRGGAAATPGGDRDEETAAASMLPRLRRLQDALQAVQRQLAREVEALEGSLRHMR